MTTYNFDREIDRKKTNSLKYDFAVERGRDVDVLPLWVADMDFQTPKPVLDALQNAVSHGIFGYSEVKGEYFDALYRWFDSRFDWQPKSEWLVKTPGVVFALAMAVRALTKEGDSVLIQPPVYYPFFEVIRDNNRKIVESPLLLTDGHYEIDFDDLEEKIASQNVKLFLLCSPHNPVGRVWTKEELQKLGELCDRYHVFVVADEIHCELVYEGHDYTPFASLSERFRQNSVTCVSPSKAFNLAGLQIANIIAADEGVRRRIDRAININEVCDVNPFGVIATIAAYNEGGAWLDALRKYLWENYEYLYRFFEQRLPQYPVLPLEGTYLVWIDCRASSIGSDATTLRLQEEQKLMVNSGTLYGPGGEGFIRLNIACPRTLLADGLERIAHVLVQNF